MYCLIDYNLIDTTDSQRVKMHEHKGAAVIGRLKPYTVKELQHFIGASIATSAGT